MKKPLVGMVICCLILTNGCGIMLKSSIEEKPQFPNWYCELNETGEILLYTEMPRDEAIHLLKKLEGMEALAIDWWYMYSPIPQKPLWVNVFIIFSNYEIAKEMMEQYGIRNICPCLEGQIVNREKSRFLS